MTPERLKEIEKRLAFCRENPRTNFPLDMADELLHELTALRVLVGNLELAKSLGETPIGPQAGRRVVPRREPVTRIPPIFKGVIREE